MTDDRLASTTDDGGRRPAEPAAPGIGTALLRVGMALVIVYGGLAVGMGWWQVVQAGPLTTDPQIR